MDEIKSFEQKHKLTKLGRPENKYPFVQLEAHYAMEKRFFKGSNAAQFDENGQTHGSTKLTQ